MGLPLTWMEVWSVAQDENRTPTSDPVDGTRAPPDPAADAGAAIRRFVRTLVQRERLLLGVRVLARTALLALSVAVWAAIAATVRVDRSAAALGAVALLGIGGWFTTALPLILGWSATGDPLRQARRVESLQPSLGGRLVTAVEQVATPAGARSPGVSGALLGLVVRRAQAQIGAVGPDRVHPARPAVRSAVVAASAWVIGLALILALGPLDVLRFWIGGGDALAEVSGEQTKSVEDLARVGDLVVRYTYPDYTGLPPKEVPNGTGDVGAPPGTTVDVTARSAQSVDAAGMVAYDERLEARLDAEGRNVSGRFAVGKERGTWHLLLYRGGGEPERSRDFAIEPQEDLPPDVMLDAAGAGTGDHDVLEVGLDDKMPLSWRARDDYGIRRVGLAIDGKESDRVLDRPDHRQSEDSGTAIPSPRELGLKPGDKVRLSVVAWDNDTVSGSKRGESRSVQVVVLGASGLDERTAERRDELLKQMVPILARFLTEPWPPGDSSASITKWGEEVAKRYQPLSETVNRLWQGLDTQTQDRAIVQRVLDSGRKLVRYTQLSFEPDSIEPPHDDGLKMVADLKTESVTALEDGILAFHTLLRNDALAQIQQQSGELADTSKALQELMASNPDPQEMLSKLDQLERMMAQLDKAANRLDEGSGLREFLKMRENEIANLEEEIRKAGAEGRTDDAKKMMQRLSQQIQEMSQGIEDRMTSASKNADDAQQSGEDLKAQLKQLEEDQKKLQSEVQALRNQDQGASQRMADLWNQLAKLSEQHHSAAAAYQQGLTSSGRPFYEQQRAQAGVDEASEIQSSVSARDVAGARTAVAEAQMAWASVNAALEAQLRARQTLSGPGLKDLRGMMGQLDQIERLLEQLEQTEQSVDPKTLQKARELEGKQRDLDNRLQQASSDAEQFQQQFPVRPQGLEDSLKDAGKRMDQAAEDLGQGQPMQAEGSQGVAAQRIQDAIDSIQQAQQQLQQMSQEMQGKGQGQKPDEGDKDQKDGQSMAQQPDLDIPTREEFQTSEEYHKALQEGMEGEVPEEYRAMKTRYFEELIQ